MGALVEFLPPPRSADRAEPGHSELVLFPTLVTRSRWLRREGLRIAAGVNGASIANVRRILENERSRAGLTGPAVAADVEAALQFVEAVRNAADRLGRLSSLSSRDGGAA